MAPLTAASAPSSRIANAASRCRRPSKSCGSRDRLLAKSSERPPDARFGSTLPLHRSASTPSFLVDGTASGGKAPKSAIAFTGRKSLKHLVAGPGGHVAYGAALDKCQPPSAEEALVSYGTASSQRTPKRAASAGSLRAWTKQQSHPRCLLPGARPKALSRVPTPSRSRPGLGASLRRPLPGRGGTELSATGLFDEVIRCDRTYGPILAEIKAAYETFLGDRGASVPEDPIAVVGFATGESTASDTRPSALRKSADNSDMAELAVDAARRRWMEPEDATSRGDFAKECELERENAAVRTLVERLRMDLVISKQNESRRQAELQNVQQTDSRKQVPERREHLRPESAPQLRPDPRAQLQPELSKFTQPDTEHLQSPSEESAHKMTQPAAASTPLRAVLPIPVRGFQAVGAAQSGQWSSARSSSASTISAYSADDSQLAQWPLGLWAARQTPPGPSTLPASRPSEVPVLDLSRISWLVDEASESNEGYENFDDMEGEHFELTPPYPADTD